MAKDSVGTTIVVKDFVKITPGVIHQWTKYRDYAITAVGTIISIPSGATGDVSKMEVRFIGNDGTVHSEIVNSNLLTKIT